MKSPVCSVCDRQFEPDGDSLVAFADYEPLPEDITGHPQGLEWVCPEHIHAARSLRHLDSENAIARLRSNIPGD